MVKRRGLAGLPRVRSPDDDPSRRRLLPGSMASRAAEWSSPREWEPPTPAPEIL